MRKLMIITAVITVVLAGAAMAEKVVDVQSNPTVANTLVQTNYIDIADFTYGYRDINKIVVYNHGANTVTINMDICEEPAAGVSAAVFTDLATYTLTTGASTNDFPLRAGTYGNISNVVYHAARKLRVIETLTATNAVQANIDYFVYGEK